MMTAELDGSFQLAVDRTPWGDISLTLAQHDLRINIEAVDALRICREIWAALGRGDQPIFEAA